MASSAMCNSVLQPASTQRAIEFSAPAVPTLSSHCAEAAYASQNIFRKKKNEFETVNMRFLVILCLGVSMLGTLRLCLCLYAVQHD